MTINFTFDSIEEMETAVCRMAESIEAKKIFEAGVPDDHGNMVADHDMYLYHEGSDDYFIVKKGESYNREEFARNDVVELPKSEWSKQKKAEKEEAPKAEEPKKEEPAPAEPAPKKEEPKIDRAEMRKLLSALNKSTGKNTARELISELGYKVLTEVPDDKLPELKAKAEEAINA